MADFLGPVEIPDPTIISPFPLSVDYGGGQEIPERVAAHLMDQPGLKMEQRFFLGNGARRFRIRKYQIHCNEYEELKTHWKSAYGAYAEFDYDHPISHVAVERYRVRYADPTLTLQHLADLLCSDAGITLVEVPQTTPDLTVAKILERYPDAGFTTDLLAQVQRITPLIAITPRPYKDTGGATVTPAVLYLSDRRSNLLGGPAPMASPTLYLPRLLEWSGISQTVGENSDSASFTFGNADEVWFEYLKLIDLTRATLDFWLFFEGSNVLLKLWRGFIQSLKFREDDSLEVEAADGIYEMNLSYPVRQISRTCWKEFNDGVWCPYGASGSLNPSFPQASATVCDKGYDSPNGCQAHRMDLHFGGQVCKAADIKIRNTDSGTSGWGRSGITSVTVRNDTIYQRVLQEIYTDDFRLDGNRYSMPVVCDVAGGRDHDKYYAALGIIGEGPIGGFHEDDLQHLLDKQPPHSPNQPEAGLRIITGHDPAQVPGYDFFQVNQHPWSWPITADNATPALPAGTPYPPDSTFCAGTSFAEIRRTDEEGVQAAPITEREMTIVVTKGMGGWIWTAPGAREWRIPLTNPVWIAINIYLRALGMKADPTHPAGITVAQMEELFDVEAAIDAAGVCDEEVNKLIGTGTERQFTFNGALREQKPLREWMQEILNTCLGYYSFSNGKLRIGLKFHSGATEAFTRANVLHRSVQAEPVLGTFNYLSGEFGDEEFAWQLNRVIIYDIDHARYHGTSTAPRYTQSQMSLVGVCGKSQASRIVTTRLREELGGTTRREQMDARNITLKTTVLALPVDVGQVCSLTHPHLPNERVEFRVMRWQLNPDWSIELTGKATCDSMYNLLVGPKPADVAATPVPPEKFASPMGMAWLPNDRAPFAGDPMVQPSDLTFSLRQSYPIETEGTYSPAVIVGGELPVNQFLEGNVPAIRGLKKYTTGGQLPGGKVYYFVVGQRSGTVDGEFVSLSNYSATYVPRTTNTNRVVLEPIQTRQTMPGYSVWVGNDIRTMTQIIDDPDTPLPASIEITGPIPVRTRGVPNPQSRRVRVKAREVYHAGVAGIQVMDVIGSNVIQSDELKGSDDPWVGHILSVISDASDGSVPLWNFTITAFDGVAGTFTVSPDCTGIPVAGGGTDQVEPGDVMIIRSRATAADYGWIRNDRWANDVGTAQFQAAAGLIPGYEVGLTLMIIAGTGRGQIRQIVANDNLTHWVNPPFTVKPDTTSIYIVTWSIWPYIAESDVLDVSKENQRLEIILRVPNSPSQTVLVGGFLVDARNNDTFEELACYREIYVYGEPYHVRTTVDDPDSHVVEVTDQTLRVDTTNGDVTIDLIAVQMYFGRKLLIVNDGTGDTPGRVIIHPSLGEEFQTGEAEIILENPGDWAELVAAGDRVETAEPPARHKRSWQRRKRALAAPRLPQRHDPHAVYRNLPMPPPDRKGQL